MVSRRSWGTRWSSFSRNRWYVWQRRWWLRLVCLRGFVLWTLIWQQSIRFVIHTRLIIKRLWIHCSLPYPAHCWREPVLGQISSRKWQGTKSRTSCLCRRTNLRGAPRSSVIGSPWLHSSELKRALIVIQSECSVLRQISCCLRVLAPADSFRR